MSIPPDQQGGWLPDDLAERDREFFAPLTGRIIEIQRFRPGALGLAAIALVVFLAGFVTLFMPRGPEEFTPIGLVASVLLAILLLTDRSRWGGVVLAAFVGELGVGAAMGADPALAVALTGCSVLQGLLCALLVLRVFGANPDMGRLSNVLRYLGLVAVAAIAGALLASSTRAAITGAPIWHNVLVWGSRDLTGMATLTPCLLILATRWRELGGLVGRRGWPLGLLAVAEFLTFFTERMPLTYVVIAALLLVTWRLRMLGAALGILMTLAIAVPATMRGYGPFSAFDVGVTEQLLTLQLFLAVAFHITVPVAAQLGRSRQLQNALAGALASVHESENRYRLIADSMRDIIVQVDREGRVVYASTSLRQLGYEPEEMSGQLASAFVHPDDLPRFLENAAHVLRGLPDDGRDHRFRARYKDGQYRWLEGSPSRLTDENGRSIGLVSVLRDVHGQRLADEALAASEARYRLLADNMADIIATYGRDGVVTFASGATMEILGYRPYELVGQSIGDMMHPDDLEPARQQFMSHRERGPGGPSFRVEFRMMGKDGRMVWLQANPRAIFDEAGRFVEWQDVVRDVTRSKAMEEALRAARAKADAAAKTRADFLADMGHEVRGPLNSIIGFGRIARSQPDRVEWCLDCIDEAARGLLTMVGDILDYSRLEAAQVQFRAEPVKLSEFLRGTLAQLEPQARAKDLDLALDDRTDGARVIATDANRLRQVLLNLLGNAVKFTHVGEVVLQVGYDTTREMLEIEVRDTGPGVPPDQLPDLFVRFSPAQPSGGASPGGVGLGLAISKSIVEGLGGQISAESQPGQGSRFRFWIPAPAVAGEPGETIGAAAPAAEPLRILVATPESALQGLVARAMARRAEVFPADDLAAATRLAAQEPLDLIIVDLALARGSSTLRRLRKASGPNSHTPALAFAQDTDDELRARAAGQGFHGLLAKSSTGPELVSGIAQALLTAEIWDHAPAKPAPRRSVGRTCETERTSRRAG